MIVKGGLTQHYNPSHVASTRIFPMEHTFAMKIHKSQGSTLNYIIISFSESSTHMTNITFNLLYATLSRVRKGDDIRILLPSSVDFSLYNISNI